MKKLRYVLHPGLHTLFILIEIHVVDLHVLQLNFSICLFVVLIYDLRLQIHKKNTSLG